MLIHEVFSDNLHGNVSTTTLLERDLIKLRVECSHFIHQTESCPVYKRIESRTSDFCKVKARTRNTQDPGLDEVFNRAFATDVRNIRQRAIYTTSKPIITEGDLSSYYVFIPDGYKFIYNSQISDSSIYKHFHEAVNNDTIVTLLQQQYQNTNLAEAVTSETEILFYNVPYFYAVNTRSVSSYSQLIAAITTAKPY